MLLSVLLSTITLYLILSLKNGDITVLRAITQCIFPYRVVPKCNCQRWAEYILTVGHNLESLVSFKWGCLFVNYFFLLNMTFSGNINWGYCLIRFLFYYNWTDYKWLKGNSVILLICGGGKSNGKFSDKFW